MYVVYGSGMNKEGYNRSESKKYPTKKISSDKKKRVVNIDKRKLSNTRDEVRPISKTGNIYDLNVYRSNERIQPKNIKYNGNIVDESVTNVKANDNSENIGSSKHINYIKSITRSNSNNTSDEGLQSKFKLVNKSQIDKQTIEGRINQVAPSSGLEKTFFANPSASKRVEEHKRANNVSPNNNISINSPFKNVYENIAKMSRMQNNEEKPADKKRSDIEIKTINTYSKYSDNSDRTYSRRNKVLNRRKI